MRLFGLYILAAILVTRVEAYSKNPAGDLDLEDWTPRREFVHFDEPSSTILSLSDILEARNILLAAGVPKENLCRSTKYPTDMRLPLEEYSLSDYLPWCNNHVQFVDEEILQPRLDLQQKRFLQEVMEDCVPEVEEPSFHDDPWFYIIHGVCALLCVTTAALAAGLTMGLLSLDPLMLLIKMRAAASEKERQQAASILPIVKQHHLLLVTLLLLNSMANEALPLFLEVLVSPVAAVILSVTFVLFFGEIIPSAVFTGPQKIELASKMIPAVKTVMFLLWPIAYPIAKVLDHVLHDDEEEDEGAFNRGELSALVRIQYEERMANKQQRKLERAQFRRANSSRVASERHLKNRKSILNSSSHSNSQQPRSAEMNAAIKAVKQEVRWAEAQSRISEQSDESGIRADTKRSSSIHADEVMIVEGALQMKTKTALDVFCPLNRMYAIPYDLILNEENVVDIYSSGYSRIPVFERNPDKPKSPAAIRGLLITKHLVVVNMNENRPISTLPLLLPPCVSPKMNLIELVNLFQTGRQGHFALVCARPIVGEEALKEGKPLPQSAGLMGIITFEDVLEELLQEQIYDENDQMEREAEKIARWVCRKWKILKKKRELEAAGKTVDMGSVVLEAMAEHENEHAGEATFLLQKTRDRGEAGTDSAGGLLGFFSSFGRQNSSEPS